MSDGAKLRANSKVKKTQGKPHKRGFPWVLVSTAAILIIILAFFFIRDRSPLGSPTIPEGTKAAIIDQLYKDFPNEDFTSQITKYLQDFGFKVDVYQGEEITVDFFRNLPSLGYKLIIFRGHSGAMGGSPQDVQSMIGTYLFTNEPYSRTKYLKEQLNDELAKAMVNPSYPYYFAIGSQFIQNSMKGNFNNTLLIVDGCSCLYKDDLAKAFTQRGASAYIAWDGTVDLDYSDKAIISLVENLCSKELTIDEAVSSTMAQEGPDPKYQSELAYYPPESAAKTLRELIR